MRRLCPAPHVWSASVRPLLRSAARRAVGRPPGQTPPRPGAVMPEAEAELGSPKVSSPLRSPPRWDAWDGSNALLAQTYVSSMERWEKGKGRRLLEFGHSKQWKTLSSHEAYEQYCLRRRDLEGLPFVAKYNVYGAPRHTRFYVLFDVQDAALERWGSAQVMLDSKAARRAKRARRIARNQPMLMLLRPVRHRKGEVHVGSRAVFAAIAGNSGVALAKLAGWATTGSASLLSESMHSLADLGNQLLLAVGLQQSLRSADATRPYGYGFELYVWAMISGVSTFILGAGASVYHGVSCLIEPHAIEHTSTALGVLLAAGVLESYTLSVAWSEMAVEARKAEMTMWQYFTLGTDPLNPAVLLEDSVAVVGVCVAGGCISLTHITGNPAYDAVGSIAVGGMMGAVAIFIINRNRNFLGQAVPTRTASVVRILQADEMVLSVQDVKSVLVGPQTARFKAEIQFNPQLLSEKYLTAHDNLKSVFNTCTQVQTEEDAKRMFERSAVFLLATLSIEVDRLEHIIRTAYPEFKYIDLEVL